MDSKEYLHRAKSWLSTSFDPESRNEVQLLIDRGGDELQDSFYKNLEFGTGGLRARMGVGTNRINRYTVGMVTQGIANYLKEKFQEQRELSVAIAFDSRENSPLFAQVTAEVFAANGFKVFLYTHIRPTPQLSFTVRVLKCSVGVMVTASHNPKEYNGYKLYWSDGAQVLPPYDQEIIRRVDRITEPQQVKWSGGEKNITLLDGEIDRAYLDQLSKLILNKRGGGESISIVYTPLHGAGVEMVPRFLKRAGFRELHIVEEQTTLDGTFATLQYPNPEEPTALKMALELAHKVDADLVLATDPDCDRVGAASKERGGGYRIFNGNEIATLLIYYILERLQHQGRLNKGNKRGYLVKTIVTTDLIRSLGAYYNVEVIEVLTGFKYIAQIVAQLEGKKEFIAGAEESHGFNVGEAVRDKDGVIASALLAEVAEWAKESRKTLSELLNGLYLKFGLYREELFSIPLMGIEAKERSTVLLEQLRATPPLSIAGEKTLLIHDYLAQESVDLLSDLRYSIELPKSNVLQYITSQNSIITVRASGTEPKLKLYIGVKESLRSIEQIEMVEKVALERIERLSTYFINHFRR